MATRPTTINPHTGEVIPAYLRPGMNQMTGNLNDPFMEAQHNFAGPGPAALTSALRRQGLSFGSLGRGGGGSVAGRGPSLAANSLDEESARSIAVNDYLAGLTDDRMAQYEAKQAQDVASRDRSDVKRAMAIASTPNVSQNGRPIVQNDDGSYETAAPTGAPVNRQAIAAQMAPGLIAPPAPDKPVTFGTPRPAVVTGPDGKPKRVFVRDGSDGQMYGTDRKPITSGLEPPPDKNAAADKLASLPTPFQSVIGRILVNAPASRRKSIEEDFAQVYETGNEAELKDQIRNAAIQTENIDTKNQVQGRMATIASLKDTSDILNEMKAKGVPTNIMTGTVEDLARKLGTSTNPEYVALANRLQGTLINYRRAATGVAFGEKEGAEYAKMFPNYRNTLPVNEALIRGLQREMKTYDDVYWESKLGKEGKKFIFGDDAPSGGGKTGSGGSGIVEMVGPGGQPLWVPAGEVEEARKAGAKPKGGG